MITCSTKKKVYLSPEIAEDVLIETWTRYDFNDGSGPIAIYRCDDCGYYHLTSKGVMNEKLARYIKEGKIKKQKEANDWLNKIKKR
ncbi:MAG TPA: hypothetical protein VL443_02480 [Cyclobacteriaceae bacterium]|jgi:hypothetical protein|nr:hypothetical protein [Cyclobacteriaceae bacterium]